MFLQSKMFRRHFWALVVCVNGVTVVWAQPVAQFEDALQKVHTYQQQSQTWQQQQQIAALNLKQSTLWQNPSVSISQDGFSQDQELSIGFRQPLDIFGQRQQQQELAYIQQQQMLLQQQLWTAQSTLIVKFLWSALLLSEFEQAIYHAQSQVSQSTLNSAEKRYQAGSIALVDYERAQIDAIEQQNLLQQAQLKRDLAQRQLANLWGETTAEFDIPQQSRLWPADSVANVQRYQQEAWLEKFYALNTTESKQEIENFKRQSRGNPILDVGMKRSKSATESNETTFAVGVELPLRIFDRQQYRIPMAEQQHLLFAQQQQRQLKQQRLDIENQLLQLSRLEQQFSISTRQIALAEQVQRRSLQGFQAGKFSMTDVQQASTQVQNTRLAQLQILRQAWQSALSAEALGLGTRYEDISSPNAYSQLVQSVVEQGQNKINIGGQ